MRILAIETSCDETAIAILDISGDTTNPTVKVLGNALLSQINIHKEYGGVFPMLAKREHTRVITSLLKSSLKEAELLKEYVAEIEEGTKAEIKKLLEKEEGLSTELLTLLENTEKPAIEAIAVTHGPGLEPALWVGVNFATALSLAWELPLIPINHMEGHILSSLLVKDSGEYKLPTPSFPLLALLISGGHTELVLMETWGTYKVIGETKDDAVGEAYDKVARMLGLPYPGGPEISKLAEIARTEKKAGTEFKLPRPMLHSDDLNFSFAGLKTAVLYTVKKIPELTETIKKALALEFENAVAEVFAKKVEKALEETGAQTFIVGGGVSANKNIRKVLSEMMQEKFPEVSFYIPEAKLTTDNAIMIGLAGYTRFKGTLTPKELRGQNNLPSASAIKAVGNLKL
jgi:N6-L-threonylcarbamoyladenine synthase